MMKIAIRFVLLLGAYLAFAGQLSTDECVAAAVSAALLVCLSIYARSWQTRPLSFAPRVVARQILPVVPKLFTDSLKLIPRMLGGGWRTGTMSQQFVPNAADPGDTAWWAVFMLTTSASPNTILVTRLARPGEVTLHRLVGQSE